MDLLDKMLCKYWVFKNLTPVLFIQLLHGSTWNNLPLKIIRKIADYTLRSIPYLEYIFEDDEDDDALYEAHEYFQYYGLNDANLIDHINDSHFFLSFNIALLYKFSEIDGLVSFVLCIHLK